MNCKKIEELFLPYLEDNISPEEKMGIEDHLKTCPDCSLLLSFIKETEKSLADFPELEVNKNLINRLYEIPSKRKRFKLRLDFLVRPELQPLFTAAAVLMIVISFYFFHPDRNFINKSIDRQIHLSYSKIGRLYAKAEEFTNSLGKYKDDIFVSFKKINPFGKIKD